MVYRLWAATQRSWIRDWRERCRLNGETPVGNGALDEALALAIEVEEHTLRGEPAAAVFLDC
eukprot:2765291-Amphidinium_carterae.1